MKICPMAYQNLPKLVQNFAKYPWKIAQDIAKVAKFRQIWSQLII